MAPAPNSRLNPQVHDRLVKACREGLFRDQAAALAGVSRPSFNRWLREGRLESENEVPLEEARYRKLYEDVSVAEAEFEAETLQRISEAGKNVRSPHAWTANAWILERKFPDRYGRNDRLRVDTDGPLVQINVSADPAARELATGLLEALAGRQPMPELEAGGEEIIGEVVEDGEVGE